VRVLLISKAMLSATAQKKADLLAALPDVRLTVVSPPFWRADDGGVQRIEEVPRAGWELVVTPMRLNGNFHLHSYPALAAILRAHRPDLVHMDEEPFNFATYQALRLARRLGAPALFTTWQNLYRAYPPPFAWMEQYNYRHAAYALAANQDAAAVLRRKGYQGPVAVFPQFGVDTELFIPRPRTPRERVRIGCVSRLKPEKGLDGLIRAYAPLAERADLVIVGRGPAEDELRALAGELGVGERVTFAGTLPSAGVAAAMADLDILVLPSRTLPNWTEQFGRVLVEAMACAVAVVGSSAGEIPNVIGDAGLVYPEGEVDALRRCLSVLLDNPTLRAEFAQQGRERAIARYAQRHIAAQTYAAWQEMLAARTAPAPPGGAT
jgi:glycosyltransferase involved in cell wall biosynthesis